MPKVNDGDDFKPSASEWNGFVDASDAYKNRFKTGGLGDPAKGRNMDIIRVKNDSGVALDNYAGVIVSAPTILPADNEDEFKRQQFWKVKKPTDAAQPFVILLQPLATDEFGIAVVSGATVCKVKMTNATDTHCDSEAGKTIPKSGATGEAEILWVAGGVGAATATGEQLAFIRIGGGGGSLGSGQYTGQAFEMVSDDQAAWDFPRATGLI